jgi:hypothetical protein
MRLAPFPIFMVARVTTVAFEGTYVLDIDMQVQMSAGLPKFNLAGVDSVQRTYIAEALSYRRLNLGKQGVFTN